MVSFTQLAVSLGALASATLVHADVVPTAPGPGDSFNEGAACPIQWNLDTTGTWTDFTIQLMTGSNFQMVPLATVASGLDGTKGDGKFSWTCPEVNPNSAIYFYQFTQAGANVSWTTRFTIASSTGESTEPTESTTIGGQTVKYGTGSLSGASVSLSSAASASASQVGSAASTATGLVGSTSPSGMTTIVTPASTSTTVAAAAAATSSSSDTAAAAVVSTASSVSSSASAASSSTASAVRASGTTPSNATSGAAAAWSNSVVAKTVASLVTVSSLFILFA